ncbi:Os05g0540400 [Oryza sativa Japonica Group]|uniref:Os05g0540400 protein n=1 Tax=Oryza sativa subsp. japonica TaxID=39947 RepID=A0A0N7KL60_ORYSJ|nr:Os05g0540400 [Oryza sativa Japonica Group]
MDSTASRFHVSNNGCKPSPSCWPMLKDSRSERVTMVESILQIGCMGRNVIIERSHRSLKDPKSQMDIEFEHSAKNVGANLVKQVAEATNKVAGDDSHPYSTYSSPKKSTGPMCTWADIRARVLVAFRYWYVRFVAAAAAIAISGNLAAAPSATLLRHG